MATQYSLRFLELSEVRLQIAEAGDPEAPLVLLVHGWPESWYSWRHQIAALAESGYHVVAPEMRGYGESDSPAEIEAFDIFHLCRDLDDLVVATGHEDATVVGHDWGAIVSWHFALLHPERVNAIVGMSVPYGGRARQSPIATWRAKYEDEFYYILYFQELDAQGKGIAEQEFDGKARQLLERLLVSPDTPRGTPEITDPKRAAGGMLPRLAPPLERPSWLTAEDLDSYVRQFETSGFRGGINYYRNFHRNWELTPHLEGARVPQPALFISGALDQVIRGANHEQLGALLHHGVADLRGIHLIENVGHWVQQEAATETNILLEEFLSTAVGSQTSLTTAP